MAVSWSPIGPTVSCVSDCDGGGAPCIGNYDFFVHAGALSDPFHLIINGQDYGIVVANSLNHYISTKNGCVDAPITVNVDGVDVFFTSADMTFCCDSAASTSYDCPFRCGG